MLKDAVERLIGPSGEGFEAARAAIRSDVIRTPLLPFGGHGAEMREIRLKAECLQPYGSFKIRATSASPPLCLRRARASALSP
ncbi:MAG: hypothetical protein ABI422_05430 [Sphingomicrobium sp.]